MFLICPLVGTRAALRVLPILKCQPVPACRAPLVLEVLQMTDPCATRPGMASREVTIGKQGEMEKKHRQMGR